MTGPILYVTAWNDMTRRPLGGGHRWPEVEEARSRYDVFESTRMVTSEFHPDGTGTYDIDDKSQPVRA